MGTFQMPFYFIETVSQAAKDAWIKQAQEKAKAYKYQGNSISATFEPVKGWRPFEKYGTNPLEIIHNCIKDYDNTVNKILFCKDYFKYEQLIGNNISNMDMFFLQGRIAAFDFYADKEGNAHRNALIVPMGVGGNETSLYNAIVTDIAYPRTMLALAYRDYYNKFPPEVKKYVLGMNLPYVKDFMDTEVSYMGAYVFPPAICEVQGNLSRLYTMQSAISFTVLNMPKIEVSKNSKTNFFWTRDSHNSTSVAQYVVSVNEYSNLSRKRIDSEQLLFPCFCIG